MDLKGFRKHQNTHKVKKKLGSCDKCDKEFKSTNALQIHIKFDHKDQSTKPEFIC